MKKLLMFFCVLFAVPIFAGISTAETYTYQPVPVDLYDLDHYKFYTWGLDTPAPAAGEVIESASLFFDDIRNYDSSSNILYVHLLDSASLGVTVGTDYQGGGNAFDGQGTHLNTWVNLPSYAQDITYDFSNDELVALNNYLSGSDDRIGLGFDPDCHFYNNGITLTIQTSTSVIPEPGTMFLLGSGLIGLAGFRRRFKK